MFSLKTHIKTDNYNLYQKEELLLKCTLIMADRILVKNRSLISKQLNICYLSVLFYSWCPLLNIFLGFSICDSTLNLEKQRLEN